MIFFDDSGSIHTGFYHSPSAVYMIRLLEANGRLLIIMVHENDHTEWQTGLALKLALGQRKHNCCLGVTAGGAHWTQLGCSTATSLLPTAICSDLLGMLRVCAHRCSLAHPIPMTPAHLCGGVWVGALMQHGVPSCQIALTQVNRANRHGMGRCRQSCFEAPAPSAAGLGTQQHMAQHDLQLFVRQDVGCSAVQVWHFIAVLLFDTYKNLRQTPNIDMRTTIHQLLFTPLVC